MKAILEFDLEDRGDRSRHRLALEADSLHGALTAMYELITFIPDNAKPAHIDRAANDILAKYNIKL